MGFRPARSSAFSVKPEAIRSRVTATIATAGSHSRNTRTARNCAAPASRALSCPGRARRLPKRIAPADFGRGAHTSPKFAADSPLEEDGFEPLVPQREGIGHFETTLIDPWPLHLREKHLPRRRDLEFAFGLLLRGICEPAQHEGSSRSSTRWL